MLWRGFIRLSRCHRFNCAARGFKMRSEGFESVSDFVCRASPFSGGIVSIKRTVPTVYATIGEIVTGKKRGRDSDDEKIIAIPIGMAVCDIAVAHLVYHSALDRGIGQNFQLA